MQILQQLAKIPRPTPGVIKIKKLPRREFYKVEAEFLHGQQWDTKVMLDGAFSVSGLEFEDFEKELNALIEKYRI